MRNVILFIIINIVVVIGYFAALSMKNPLIGFTIVIVAWIWLLNKSFPPS